MSLEIPKNPKKRIVVQRRRSDGAIFHTWSDFKRPVKEGFDVLDVDLTKPLTPEAIDAAVKKLRGANQNAGLQALDALALEQDGSAVSDRLKGMTAQELRELAAETWAKTFDEGAKKADIIKAILALNKEHGGID